MIALFAKRRHEMKPKNFLKLFAFLGLVVIVGLACNGGASPASPPQQPAAQPAAQEDPPQNSGGSGLVTFTDQNELYQIDIPGNWNYEQTSGDNYYADVFTAPDEGAKVENIVYNDGTAFSGGQNGRFALDILNTFYSSTGEAGDIRVTDDSIMKDGSERLTWQSRGGDYSGVSFFEIRGSDRKTFLMFTVYWLDDAEDFYSETLNNVIDSYRLP
jgi:hypothetical protein